MKFEKALTALENVVEQLESGDLSLDDAFKAFEKGVKLTRDCQNQLKEVEQKVQILMADEANTNPSDESTEAKWDTFDQDQFTDDG